MSELTTLPRTNQSTNPDCLHFHPEREALFNELHARPFPILATPARLSQLVLLPDQSQPAAEFMHLLELCQRFAVLPPNRQSSCYLSLGIDRASELLRARMDLTIETQNQQLMQTMNRRSHAQWRLQQTVEGLSVAAISYCLIGLSKNLAESAKAFGLINSSTLATGIAVLFVSAWPGWACAGCVVSCML